MCATYALNERCRISNDGFSLLVAYKRIVCSLVAFDLQKYLFDCGDNVQKKCYYYIRSEHVGSMVEGSITVRGNLFGEFILL